MQAVVVNILVFHSIVLIVYITFITTYNQGFIARIRHGLNNSMGRGYTKQQSVMAESTLVLEGGGENTYGTWCSPRPPP